MKLSPEESRILRRDLAAVDGLFRKGMLSLVGGRVVVTDAGQTILDAHKKAVSLARSKAGRVGGPEAAKARVAATTKKQRKQIAKHAAEVRHGGPQ